MLVAFFPLVYLPRRLGVDWHLLSIFTQVFVGGEVGGIGEGYRGGGGGLCSRILGGWKGYQNEGGVWVGRCISLPSRRIGGGEGSVGMETLVVAGGEGVAFAPRRVYGGDGQEFGSQRR